VTYRSTSVPHNKTQTYTDQFGLEAVLKRAFFLFLTQEKEKKDFLGKRKNYRTPGVQQRISSSSNCIMKL